MRKFHHIYEEITSEAINDDAVHASIHDESNFARNFAESFYNFSYDPDEMFRHFKKHPDWNSSVADADHDKNNVKALLDAHPINELKPREKSAVKNYTSESMHINRTLWEKHKGKVKFARELKHRYAINKLSSVINKFRTPHDITLYSSSIHDPREHKNAEGHMIHPAFLSTSHDVKVAAGRDLNYTTDEDNDMHYHIYKIHVPKGSRGLHVGDHPELTNHGFEKEFILPAGTKLQHHKTVSIKHPEDKTQKLHFHHMSVVND